jgi:hypothetical protein
MRNRIPALFFLLVLAGLSGCDGSSTDPIETPLIFEGEVAFQGTEFHTFTVINSGLLRIELPRLREKVVEGMEPLGLDLTIGLGLGRPVEDECATRYSVRAREGDTLLLSLSGAEFCVSIFDPGTLLADQVAEYTISVSAD